MMEGIFSPNGLPVQGAILYTGVVGQLYVAHMNVKGFYYWAVSNIILICMSLYIGGYGMVLLYVYYLVMAIYSVLRWNGLQEQEKQRAEQYKELLEIAEAFVAFMPDAGEHQSQLEQARRILQKQQVRA